MDRIDLGKGVSDPPYSTRKPSSLDEMSRAFNASMLSIEGPEPPPNPPVPFVPHNFSGLEIRPGPGIKKFNFFFFLVPGPWITSSGFS